MDFTYIKFIHFRPNTNINNVLWIYILLENSKSGSRRTRIIFEKFQNLKLCTSNSNTEYRSTENGEEKTELIQQIGLNLKKMILNIYYDVTSLKKIDIEKESMILDHPPTLETNLNPDVEL